MLATRGLTRRFGGLLAVNKVDLVVEPGEVRAVIGPNGAGKTTLFNLISGAIPPSSGSVAFRGDDITRQSPEQIFRRGIVRSFQVSNLFGSLSVRENVEIVGFGSARHSGSPLARYDKPRAELADRIDAAIERVGLAHSAAEPCASLSHGDRRLVEIAMVLAAQPAVVLLDEPTAGMSPDETRQTAQLVRSLAPQVTVIIVEHDMSVVMSICDRITVMHRGGVLAEGTPSEIRAHDEVQAVYFGPRKH
jgi:branched-chain amino acid transport system ATP-binding protein